MNFAPDASLWVLLAGLAVAFVLLVVGFVAGRLVSQTQQLIGDANCARKALFQLHELASGVADDVGQHTSRVREINSELTAAKSAGSPSLDTLVLGRVAEIIQANERLQGQLAHAEVKLQEQAREIENQTQVARTDALTNLNNRRAFDDELNRRFAEWQRRGSGFSLVMMDIDHFKRFNDSHGHQVGDAVLRGIARTLAATMREMDLVARYGGEEIVALLPATNLAEGIRAAERARAAVAACTFHADEKDLQVTMSLGVAEVAQSDNAGLLVKRADAALYAAKSAGRNRVYFHDGQNCQPGIPPATEIVASKKDSVPSPPLVVQKADVGASMSGQKLALVSPEPPSGSRTLSRANFNAAVDRRLLDCKNIDEPLSLLLIEVDDFKNISQRLGSAVGDFILQSVMEALESAIRTTDVVSRYGYGQLAVMLPGTSLATATDMADRLQLAIDAFTIETNGPQLRFAIHFGLTESDPGDDAQSLIRRAGAVLLAKAEPEAALHDS